MMLNYLRYGREGIMVYLYPDMYTVMVGEFVMGKMVRAKEGRVTACRCKNNMIEMKYALLEHENNVIFIHENT